MIKNYLTIALRHLRRHKGYAFINVAGLTVGVACCLLLFLFVQDELRFDRFHERADRTYRVFDERVADTGTSSLAFTPPAMGPTLAREFPEVERAARFFFLGRTLVERDREQFFEPNVYLADSTVFDVFSFQLVRGDAATALTAPYTLVMSQSAAHKYFGNADPVGQTLTLSGDDVFTVTGVFEDLPAHSHLRTDLMGSFATMRDFVPEERLSNWIWQQFYTYVLLREGTDAAQLEAKLPAFIERYATPETSQRGFSYRTHLQPLTDIYLHSANLRFDVGPRGNIAYVYSFSAVALFVLLIACFNFMNLATARSMRRAREVGLRKVVGAQRGQLIRQFLGEAMLLALGATLLAVALVALVLPAFNDFTGKALTLHPAQHPVLLPGLLAASLLVGAVAGSYPAFFLSAFRPIQVLKGSVQQTGYGLSAVRKGLVIVQFTISTVLLVGTAVVYQQLDYVQHKDLGFDEEQVVVLPLRGDMDDNLDAVKAELLRHPGVTAATASWGVPGEWIAGDDVRLPGHDDTWPAGVMLVDHDFLDTYRMQLAAGRGFSRDFPSDASEAFVLNETAARALGWSPEEAVGQELWWDEWSEDTVRKGHVIGVVNDFHQRSLHQPIGPAVLLIDPSSFGQLSVRIRPEEMATTLDHLEATWHTWAPAWPFEYEFLDEDLADEYEAEQKAGTLAAAFAGLAIVIACLGLFGLAAFTAEQRTKEIGIRKVLGASVGGLVLLLSKDFVRLVAVAFVVAAPLAYLAMNRWLDAFAYRIDLSWWLFLVAGLLALAVALLTVSYQSIRAALTDPVKTLRYE